MKPILKLYLRSNGSVIRKNMFLIDNNVGLPIESIIVYRSIHPMIHIKNNVIYYSILGNNIILRTHIVGFR